MGQVLNGPFSNDPVENMLREANMQQTLEKERMARLQQALNNPHTIHKITRHIIAVGVEGESKMLVIATESGDRIEVQLDSRMSHEVARALISNQSKQESA